MGWLAASLEGERCKGAGELIKISVVENGRTSGQEVVEILLDKPELARRVLEEPAASRHPSSSCPMRLVISRELLASTEDHRVHD